MLNTIFLIIIIAFQIYLAYKIIRIDKMFDSQREYNKKMANIDQLYEDAKKIVIEAGKASASLLQRRLRIGYARSAQLLDMLEEKGVISPGDGAEPRKVLEKL